MASEDWPFSSAWNLHGNKDIVSRYEILERIGEGTFGEVHRARRREDGLIVALKEIHDSTSSDRELKALVLLDHPNVVKLHEYFTHGSSMVLVLEYLPHNLSEVIRAGKAELSDGEVKAWMIQILQGLAACHAASVLHRDLKPNNLLISEDRILKIADFGQARILSERAFVNEEGLSESDVHKDCGTGTGDHSVHDAPTMSDKQESEFQAGVPVTEGRMGGDTCVKQAGLLSRTTKGEASGGRDFASALRESESREINDTRLGFCPTNVGFSVLADAVKDARNYFTVEEMVRSGTEMDGLGLSGLQRHHVIGAQHAEDPGCCGWFPMENVENHPAMVGVRNLSSGNEAAGKDNVVSVGRDQVREREENSSSDASDVDWKGTYGVRSEGLIDTLKKTEETHKAGISSSSAKGDGDFLQKFRRFIRKRTRRLNTEGKIGGPVYSRNERISTNGGGNRLKEAQRDGQTPYMHRSLGPRNNAPTERNSGNVKSIPPVSHSRRTGRPSENIVSSQGGQVYSEAQVRTGRRNLHGKERKSFQVRSTNDLCQGPVVADGHRLESMDSASAVSRLEDQNGAQQSLVKEGDGSIVPEKSAADFMDGDDDGGDLRTESGRKLYGGLKVEKVEMKTRSKVVVNGPLREMANATAHEGGEAAALAHPEFRNSFPVDGREFSEAETETGGAALTSLDVPAGEVWGASTWGMGGKDVDGREETADVRWEGASAEQIAGRDVCKSWTQTEEYNSTLSDVEGTRWYGAPEFQYSYMDSKIAGGKVTDEVYGRATGSDGEWEEEGSEGGIYSQESPERGNSESEDGSDFTTMVGTRWYKAPELLYGATEYGMGIDIWAVGCIFGELSLGKGLFPGLNDIDQLSRVVRILGSPNEKVWAGVSLLPDFNKICFVDDRSPITLKKYLPNISEAALDFLQKLLTYDPVLRPTAAKALEDEFFCKEPLPCPFHELQLPTGDGSEASDEEWGDWKDPGSPFSDFEILG